MAKLFKLSRKGRKWLKWLLGLAFSGIGTAVLIQYFPSSRPPSQSIEADHGSTAAGRDITATASEGGTAVIHTGTGGVCVTNIHGVSEAELQRVAEELGVTKSALKSFFRILEVKEVAPEDLDSKLREFAIHYKELSAELEKLAGKDPAIIALKREARETLDAGDFDRAEQLLNQAFEKDVEAAKQLQETAKERMLSAAGSKFEIGKLRMAQLDYAGAAAHYQQAAELVPEGSDKILAQYLNEWGCGSLSAGDYARAEPPLKRSLSITERVMGPVHPKVASNVNNLAELYRKQSTLTRSPCTRDR